MQTIVVAGTRFARMPTGYEPVEVLLLQPAKSHIIRLSIEKSKISYYSEPYVGVAQLVRAWDS